MLARQPFSPQVAGTTPLVTFDFTADLAAGETILSQTVACRVYSGIDTNASSIVAASPSASGSIVTEQLNLNTAGVVGVLYELSCRIVTSLSQALTKTGYLALVPDLP